jgi:hypothetical protein
VSVYVGPVVLAQMTADTPWELLDAVERLGLEVEGPAVRITPRIRGIAVSMGAIELSRREFVQKLEEINDNGRGSGPNLQQICR